MNRNQEYENLMKELDVTPEDMTQFSPKTKARARKRNIIRRTIMPPSVLISVLLMMMVAVNISPTVAHAFERIPALRQIAAAMYFDQSLTDAIENEFIQRIDQVQTVNGITMRVEYVIVDQRQLNIFYTLDSPVYAHFNSWTSVLCAEEMQHLPVSITWTQLGDYQDERRSIRRSVVNFFDNQVPGQLVMETQVSGLEALQMEATMPVPVSDLTEWEHIEPEITATFNFVLEFDPNFTEQGETFYVNTEFEIDGQRLTVTTVEIYPTHMRVNFSADPANTAWLISLDFYAENERGSHFGAISSGIRAFGAYGTRMMASHVLHSPFFAESERLTLFIEQAEWLDKDMERVRVDLANGTADRLPEGVTLHEARRDGDSWHLSFAVEERAENHSHQIFGTRYFDEAGNEYNFTSWVSGMRRGMFSDEYPVDVFFVEFALSNYSYDIVYLSPAYSRVVRPYEPVVLRIR